MTGEQIVNDKAYLLLVDTFPHMFPRFKRRHEVKKIGDKPRSERLDTDGRLSCSSRNLSRTLNKLHKEGVRSFSIDSFSGSNSIEYHITYKIRNPKYDESLQAIANWENQLEKNNKAKFLNEEIDAYNRRLLESAHGQREYYKAAKEAIHRGDPSLLKSLVRSRLEKALKDLDDVSKPDESVLTS